MKFVAAVCFIASFTSLTSGFMFRDAANSIKHFFQDSTTKPPGVAIIPKGRGRHRGTRCDKRLTRPSGVFTSPRYPRMYPNNLACSVVIEVDAGSQVKLHLNKYDIERSPHGGCFDVLEIYDGEDHSNRLAEICGRGGGNIFVSDTNIMEVFFKTDYNVRRKGYTASYEAISSPNAGNGVSVPGDTVTCSNPPAIATGSGTIMSPHFPDNYGNHVKCGIVLKADPGKQVKLMFTQFAVEAAIGGQYCWDAVLVFDGKSRRSNKILQLCGDRIPDDVISTSGALTVMLKSDYSSSDMGFEAIWISIDGSGSGNGSSGGGHSNATGSGIGGSGSGSGSGSNSTGSGIGGSGSGSGSGNNSTGSGIGGSGSGSGSGNNSTGSGIGGSGSGSGSGNNSTGSGIGGSGSGSGSSSNVTDIGGSGSGSGSGSNATGSGSGGSSNNGTGSGTGGSGSGVGTPISPATNHSTNHSSSGGSGSGSIPPSNGTGNLCVHAHNVVRRQHMNTPDLVYDSHVAASAQAWARHLADVGKFQHSNTSYGENLFTGWGGAFDEADAVSNWYSEIDNYDYTTPRFHSSTGHFTQVVWKSSVRVGCGVATDNAGGITIVAQYDPPGNYAGLFGDQVADLKPTATVPVSANQLELP